MAHPVFRFNLADDSEATFSKIKVSRDWLLHCLPVIALQRPVYNNGQIDIKEMLQRLQKCSYEYEGYPIEGSQILALWKFLCITNRSSILQDSQTKAPSLSSAVPLILWAYKHQHNVPYEAWSSNPIVKSILGKDLACLVDVKEWDCPWDDSQIAEIRNVALKELKTGVRQQDTSNKLNKVGAKLPTCASFDELPKMVRYMVLQTWIYHPSIRKDTMITDWKNWDSLKPSIYANSSVIKSPKDELDDIFAGIVYKWDPLP